MRSPSIERHDVDEVLERLRARRACRPWSRARPARPARRRPWRAPSGAARPRGPGRRCRAARRARRTRPSGRSPRRAAPAGRRGRARRSGRRRSRRRRGSRSAAAPVVSPRRAARSRTCAPDSSPVAYRTPDPAATPAATWSRSVDLPMPGSPPTRTTDPATSPPPSTRSNSPIPTGRRTSASPSSAWDRATGTAPPTIAVGTLARLVADDGLDERVPLAARPALALPAGNGGATGLADESTLDAGHGRLPVPQRSGFDRGLRLDRAAIDRPLASGSRSISIVSPWLYRPSSRCSASGSSIRFWIVRRSGRAP